MDAKDLREEAGLGWKLQRIKPRPSGASSGGNRMPRAAMCIGSSAESRAPASWRTAGDTDRACRSAKAIRRSNCRAHVRNARVADERSNDLMPGVHVGHQPFFIW